MKKSDKRADIMQAALELIAERGFHAAGINRASSCPACQSGNAL